MLIFLNKSGTEANFFKRQDVLNHFLFTKDDSADVWDDNQIVDWKDIEDEPDTFIVVSDADTENTEWSEDIENLDRSKRQEDEFEGSGDDTPILPTNSTPAEEAKAVVPPSDTAESGPPAENTADATPANEEEVSESSAPPEVAAPPPLLQAASVDVAQPSETPTAGKSRSVASGDEAKKSEGETPPAATSEENKARAAVGASASTGLCGFYAVHSRKKRRGVFLITEHALPSQLVY